MYDTDEITLSAKAGLVFSELTPKQYIQQIYRNASGSPQHTQSINGFVGAVLEYVGDDLLENDIRKLVSDITEVDLSLRDRQKAAAKLNSILVSSAIDPSGIRSGESEARYQMALTAQEMLRELSHRVMAMESAEDSNLYYQQKGEKVTLTSHLDTVFKTSDLIHIGDTEHSENRYSQQWLSEIKNLEALVNQGVRHIFLERSIRHQSIADDLVSGRLTKFEFVKKMNDERVVNGFRNDTENELDETASIILNASKVGIRVHFADPWDMTVSNSTIQEHLQDVANPDLPEPYRQKAGEAVVEAYVADAGEPIREFVENRVNMLLRGYSDFKEKALESFIFEKKLTDLRTQFDHELATYIHNVLQTDGGKGLLFYGAAHGRHNNGNDLNDQLRLKGNAVQTINLYLNDEARQRDIASLYHPEQLDKPNAFFVLGQDGDLNSGLIYDLNVGVSDSVDSDFSISPPRNQF